ncbi:MAG: DUF2164 domain-containing protein [Neisseriaceae bacterium]|nr:DUF2164 domain-containing protein [Neisseriaceae bacterium]MBP6860965.1 DUF2164 domain-containing protein [Neisseriaceae bacterium]
MDINLEKHQRDLLAASLIKYFDHNLDHDLGNLDAGFLLDFILEEVGPSIYNQAVRDVQNNLLQRVQEVDAEVFVDEVSYWSKPRR